MDAELLKRAERRLSSWDRVVILSHARPDGDGLGAMGAMKRVLASSGRSVTALVYEDVPHRYRFLDEACGFAKWEPVSPDALGTRFDGIMIVDTCSWSQLEPVADVLRASSLPRIVVDHHATRDDLSGPGADTLYVIDASAASTCGMLHGWSETTGWKIDAVAAEALFTGIVTDTGWFRFSNTDGVTLRSAAALVEKGIRPDVLYTRLYASHSPARLGLLGDMLATLTFHADGAAAVTSLTPEAFARSGASKAETEDLVNEPLSVRSVVVSVLLTDVGDGEIRISFRSKSPEVAGRDVDVAALAGRFGGGGHRRAAGARVDGRLPDVRQRVTSAVIAALGSCSETTLTTETQRGLRPQPNGLNHGDADERR